MLAVALALPSGLRAQGEPAVLPAPAVALVGGVVSTDFGEADPAGDGTVFGLRLDFPLSSHIVLEPSVERLSLDFVTEDSDGTSVRWQADFALRAELPLDRIRPFIGGSLGVLLWPGDVRPSDEDFVTATYGGAGGVIVGITERLGLRAEARLRWLDGLESSTTTLTGGLSWRF